LHYFGALCLCDIFFSTNFFDFFSFFADLHIFGACGKVVNGMCTPPLGFVHFSLAPPRTVGENPSSFGAVETWSCNRIGLRGTTGAQNISFQRGQELQSVTL
jgi:hypothetical protein